MLEKLRSRVAGAIKPVALAISHSGLSPNQISLIGFAVSLLSAYAFFEKNQLWGGVLLLLAGLFDILDGAVAKATGRVTKFGGVLDSILDRYSDLTVLGAILIAGLCDPISGGTCSVRPGRDSRFATKRATSGMSKMYTEAPSGTSAGVRTGRPKSVAPRRLGSSSTKKEILSDSWPNSHIAATDVPKRPKGGLSAALPEPAMTAFSQSIWARTRFITWAGVAAAGRATIGPFGNATADSSFVTQSSAIAAAPMPARPIRRARSWRVKCDT